MFYYDGLANQDTEIKLSIELTDDDDEIGNELQSPLELCIKTKWKNARIDWIGSDRLL